MHLVADYIHKTPRWGRCRIRVYLPEEERDSPVVICSELPNNPGQSITSAAERIAAEVIESHKLPTPLVWIEHYPPESTNRQTETFDLVIFSDYEVKRVHPPYIEEGAIRIGEPTWKSLDRRTVQMLVGKEV